MPEFFHEGHRISYDDYGEGDRPLVLIHGLLMNRRMFDRLAPEMAARGNRVLTIDLLGHGRSDRPPGMVNYSMTFFAQQVVGLLDHLELDQAVIGGTSLGRQHHPGDHASLPRAGARNDGRDAGARQRPARRPR